jgi:hypothetical protein
MTELATFWNNQHPLNDIADEKFNALVPGSGKCDTLQGELIRASSKISYDWFNNGWGCNNWSGAVVFIGRFFGDLPVQPSKQVYDELIKALKVVHEYSHGEPCHIADEKADALVTKIHEIIVQGLIDNPEPIVNTRDMYDFQEEEYRPMNDEDDEDDEEY